VDSKIAELLPRVSQGDQAALAELTPLVYSELHRMAQIQMRHHRRDRTSEPSSLVHEAYMRLFNGQHIAFRDRSHFMGITAHIMRQVLVDHARAKKAQKRGQGMQVGLTGSETASQEKSVDVLALNEALDLLSRRNAGLVNLVELRFFGGLTADEIAGATGRSVHAVRHDLRYAQAWLRMQLGTRSPEASKNIR
jgi:RNA polymerase sigma factor (TIGR02999 family)